ncbi:phosphohydrolase [Candidatus Parcubacteria bacterium]|nr:MAG: phosphohydrolase [Candidatus Parcubacteria bacterium]
MIDRIKKIAEEEMKECAAHDLDHVMRVHALCKSIAKKEKDVDLEILEIATLLHDVGKDKENNDKSGATDHAVVGVERAEEILREIGYLEEKIDLVKQCILTHRYRAGREPKSLEAKILFDADKLDSLGAIGIARSFAWIGKHRAKVYKKVADLDRYIDENMEGHNKGKIQDKSIHSVQIEYDIKQRDLLEKFYTKSARKIAEKRHEYFKDFLDRLEREILGEE